MFTSYAKSNFLKQLFFLLHKVYKVLAGRTSIPLSHRLSNKFIEYFNTSPFNLILLYKPESLTAPNRNYFDGSNDASVGQEFDNLKRAFIHGSRKNNNGDLNRLLSLVLNLKHLENNQIKGAFAELGVYKGNTASVLAYFAARTGQPIYLFDTFSGFESRDLVGLDKDEDDSCFLDTSIDQVREVIAMTISSMDNVYFVKGYFPDSLNDVHQQQSFAGVSIDCDLYKPMEAGLDFFWPRMVPGGMIFLHDYSSGCWKGATAAIDEFCTRTNVSLVLLPDKSGTAILTKPRG